MAVFRWQRSWSPLHDLEREVDRLLESMKLPFPGFRWDRQFPAVNVYELDHEYWLVAEIPGVVADTLELTVVGGMLTIRGTRPSPEDVPDEKYRRHERFWGDWERTLQVPERVDEEQVFAEFNDGILKVRLPKLPDVKPRQIPVIGTSEDEMGSS